MKVLEAQFRSPVKFPSAKQGVGKNVERILVDHPETPRKDYAIAWVPVNGSFEIVVTHIASGITVGVPRENVGWTRPPLSELLAASKSDATAKR